LAQQHFVGVRTVHETSTASSPKGGIVTAEEALPWAAQPIATETTHQVLGVGPEG